MDAFLHVAAFSSHQDHNSPRPSAGRTLSHMRSFSSVQTVASLSPDRPRVPTKSLSHSHVPVVPDFGSKDYSNELSTLPDPRSRARTPNAEEGQASPTHHPDLSEEVATLSTKLINAINHQTSLDDTLSATRHELDSAKLKIKELENQNSSLRTMMAGEVWVRRSTLDQEKKTMQNEKKQILIKLEEEKDKRLETDKEKRKIEQELENLTQALFEEANKMVVRAKEEANEEHLVLQRKNDQLKSQLDDSEGLLKSQQEQLSQLKAVMESLASEKDDQTNVTCPSSPAVAHVDSREEDGLAALIGASLGEGHSPAHPLSFYHVIHPVLRTDLSSYDDFVSLARSSRQRVQSRVSSSSIGGLSNSLNLTNTAAQGTLPSSNSGGTLNSSTGGSSPQSPITPSMIYNPTSPSTPQLKDTRYYKRVLAEDIEPTLRLDQAPGLSWLARRTVINSMSEGSLVVEPVPTSGTLVSIAPPQHYPCSLCGETRKDSAYLRNHRFRTSESESSQRYPLCKYCLGRVRSTCDFLGFMRMVKDGHYRADGEDQERAAWEESVKLREQMFWARIGGGVVPLAQGVQSSRRPSHAKENGGEDVSDEETSADQTTEMDLALEDGPRTSSDQETPSFSEPRTPPAQTGVVDGKNIPEPEFTEDLRPSIESVEREDLSPAQKTG